MTDDGLGFQAPQTITPEGLADDLTVLVWESFTDFISERESSSTTPSSRTWWITEHHVSNYPISKNV